MTTYPILFSAPMIRAILREIEKPGTGKTQTRRLAWRDAEFGLQDYSSEQLEEIELKGWLAEGEGNDGLWRVYKPTRWQRLKPGDLLWVREAWQYTTQKYCYCPQGSEPSPCDDWLNGTGCRSSRDGVVYRAETGGPHLWRPSIHMPRWASRLTLYVEDVKVERLQDISEADAKAEGCGLYVPGHGFITEADLHEGYSNYLAPRLGFEAVWTKISGAASWAANPWVVAVTFRPHLCNVDAMPAGAAS